MTDCFRTHTYIFPFFFFFFSSCNDFGFCAWKKKVVSSRCKRVSQSDVVWSQPAPACVASWSFGNVRLLCEDVGLVRAGVRACARSDLPQAPQRVESHQEGARLRSVHVSDAWAANRVRGRLQVSSGFYIFAIRVMFSLPLELCKTWLSRDVTCNRNA